MISVKVTGLDRTIKSFNTMAHTIPKRMNMAMDEILIRIRDVAIQNVMNDLKWGLSLNDPHITSTSNWIIEDTSEGKTLTCTSPHAFIVEYGAIGGMVVRQPSGGPPFAIGANQGINLGPRYSFKLQEGKHYLQRATDLVVNGSEMELIAYKHLTDAIRSM